MVWKGFTEKVICVKRRWGYSSEEECFSRENTRYKDPERQAVLPCAKNRKEVIVAGAVSERWYRSCRGFLQLYELWLLLSEETV